MDPRNESYYRWAKVNNLGPYERRLPIKRKKIPQFYRLNGEHEKKRVTKEDIVTIVKFKNRKYYCKKSFSYINISHIIQIIREGTPFRIVDKSGHDITHESISAILRYIMQTALFNMSELCDFITGKRTLSIQDFKLPNENLLAKTCQFCRHVHWHKNDETVERCTECKRAFSYELRKKDLEAWQSRLKDPALSWVSTSSSLPINT